MRINQLIKELMIIQTKYGEDILVYVQDGCDPSDFEAAKELRIKEHFWSVDLNKKTTVVEIL